MHVVLSKSALFLYRTLAIFALYGVLVGVLAYAVILGFYGVNTSWVAPIILSALDDKGLELTEKLLTSKQSLEALTLDVNKLESGLSEMKQHKAALQALEPQVKTAIVREISEGKANGRDLSVLDAQKRNDNIRTRAVLTQISEVESTIHQDLAAGLITKGDAAVQTVQLNQVKGSYTDGQISEVLLRDGVLQKSTTSSQTLDALDKRVELESQIAQLAIAIDVADKQIRTEKQQIASLNKAIGMATQTPYFSTVSGGGNETFAFVPYDNQSSVSVGAPIYDCYLNIIACRRVGEVHAIFSGEEKAQNPIFRTDMRGFLVQLKLENQDSPKSKTLFLKRKPLLF